MKLVLAMMLLAACSGAKPRPESPIVDEGSAAVPANCCCKSDPIASADNKPVYGLENRMECSVKHGACVPDVQCRKTEPQ